MRNEGTIRIVIDHTFVAVLRKRRYCYKRHDTGRFESDLMVYHLKLSSSERLMSKAPAIFSMFIKEMFLAPLSTSPIYCRLSPLNSAKSSCVIPFTERSSLIRLPNICVIFMLIKIPNDYLNVHQL